MQVAKEGLDEAIEDHVARMGENVFIANGVDPVKRIDATEWQEASPRKTPSSVGLARACCLLKKPCQHWIWDGTSQSYTNSLTGEVREVES